MAYEYGTFTSGNGDAVPVTEQNLPPFLVIWLLFVVNPNILGTAGPTQYAEIGAKLDVTPQCVQKIFEYVSTTATAKAATQSAAQSFQAITTGPGGYPGGGSSCGHLSTILNLASKGAVSAW